MIRTLKCGELIYLSSSHQSTLESSVFVTFNFFWFFSTSFSQPWLAHNTHCVSASNCFVRSQSLFFLLSSYCDDNNEDCLSKQNCVYLLPKYFRLVSSLTKTLQKSFSSRIHFFRGANILTMELDTF